MLLCNDYITSFAHNQADTGGNFVDFCGRLCYNVLKDKKLKNIKKARCISFTAKMKKRTSPAITV